LATTLTCSEVISVQSLLHELKVSVWAPIIYIDYFSIAAESQSHATLRASTCSQIFFFRRVLKKSLIVDLVAQEQVADIPT